MDRIGGWSVRIAGVCAMALVMALSVGTASAQTFRGTILGTVTDATGASVAGATVTVHNVDTGVERTTETTTDGGYLVPELPVGNYTVTIERSGFQKAVTTAVTVDVALTRRVDAVLKPGAISQRVIVEGESLPQVEMTRDTLGGVLTQSEIKDLPVNGRDYTKLIFLTPGAAGSPDQISDSPGSYGEFSMNGARGRSNNYLLDGTDMNDGYRNDPAINQAGVFGTPSAILPIDAVSEFNVLSNFEPEYGRNGGAVVNIVTKSGTNALHGDAFEYFRNNVLDARNYFNTTNQPQAPFRNNQFGGSLGGPIIKDKAFFYADYEGQREGVGVVNLACVPSPADLAKVTNPVIQSLLAHYPNSDPWPLPNIIASIPTMSGCPNGPDSSVTAPSYNNLTSAIAKVDYNFNKSNILTGRYFVGDSVQAFPLALTGGGILPGFDTFTPTRVQLVSISYVRIISPTKVNEARLGWNRFAEGFLPQDSSFAPSSVNLCAASSVPACSAGVSDSGLPVISVTGFAQLGASHSTPRHRFDSNWQAIDNFSWKVGKHNIKMGYEYRRTTIQQLLGINYRGSLTFNGLGVGSTGTSLGDFLSGFVDSGSEAFGPPIRHTFQNNHGLYIQDSLQLTSRLTVNYGLRWDYYGVFTEKDDLASNVTNFDVVDQTVTLTQVGSPGLSQLYKPDYKNFAPRLSIAWDPFGRGRTIIRAGYGIFYDVFSQDFFMGQVPYNSSFDPGPTYNPFGPAAITSVSAVGGAIGKNVPVFSPPGETPTGDIFAVDQHIHTPYIENYNLNIQQQITNKLVLQVGYVGSQGHRLFHFLDLNQPDQATITATDIAYADTHNWSFTDSMMKVHMGPCVTAGVITGGPGCIPTDNPASRVFANNPYGAVYINDLQTTARSNYNSLQASLRVTDWHGITSVANYVWSHSLDSASDGFEFIPNGAMPNDSTRPNLEYGDSNFDIRNRFTWVFAYNLPHMTGGWQKLKNGWGIDSAVTLQDGQPWQLNYNFESDFSGSGENYDRPDVVGPIQYNSGNPFQYLNLTSFAVPCTLTQIALTPDPMGTGPTTSGEDCLPGTRHFGNEGRTSLKGPTFKQWDLALYKDTPLTERLHLQLRAEFFNILNHPNFSNPFLPAFISDPAANGSTITNGRETGQGFFAIGATGDVGIGNPFLGGGAPRGIQLAAKFMF